MSCTVKLIYNPYSQAATLQKDEQEFSRSGSRMDKCLIGKPMSDWLEANVKGYRQWNGFLPELMAEINEDDIRLIFSGKEEDYQHFTEAVLRQNTVMAENAGQQIKLEIEYVEMFSVKKLLQQMKELRTIWDKQNIYGATQQLNWELDALDAQLKTLTDEMAARKLGEDYIQLLVKMVSVEESVERKNKMIKMRWKWENLLKGVQ